MSHLSPCYSLVSYIADSMEQWLSGGAAVDHNSHNLTAALDHDKAALLALSECIDDTTRATAEECVLTTRCESILSCRAECRDMKDNDAQLGRPDRTSEPV